MVSRGEAAAERYEGVEGWGAVRKCNLGAQGPGTPQGRAQTGGREVPDGEGNGSVGNYLLQALQNQHRWSSRPSKLRG